MAKRNLQDYNKEELLQRLLQKDRKIQEYKDTLKKAEKAKKELIKLLDSVSAKNREMREAADQGFANSIERVELLEKVSLNWNFFKHQESISAMYASKFHEAQGKYDLLLSRLSESDAEIFEGIFKTDTDWKNCEQKRLQLQAQNDCKDQKIKLLQETLETYQQELAVLRQQASANPRGAGRKPLPEEIRQAILSMRTTPKEDGSLPTIREIAGILQVSVGTVAKYLKEDK